MLLFFELLNLIDIYILTLRYCLVGGKSREGKGERNILNFSCLILFCEERARERKGGILREFGEERKIL